MRLLWSRRRELLSPHMRACVPALVLTCIPACAPGSAARPLAAAPEYRPEGTSKCSVVASQSQPLIVEWPSTERAKLEASAKKGPVVVRYSGCEMQILDRCKAKGAYSYVPTTRKRDTITIKNSDELYANIPIGAAKLESALERSGELNVSLTIVGRYEAASDVYKPEELEGECAGATHVVTGVTVGAFKFFAGAMGSGHVAATVLNAGGGAGASSSSNLLTEDGLEEDCDHATRADAQPPGECGALLRIEVVKLGEMKKEEAVCPEGTAWDGSACIAKRVVTEVSCPSGTKWDGKNCLAADGTLATEVRDDRTPDATLVDFVGTDPSMKWSLVDPAGRLHCRLPCSRWVAPNSGLQLKGEWETAAGSMAVSGDLPRAVGPAGAHETATVHRSADLTLPMIWYGAGVAGLATFLPLTLSGAANMKDTTLNGADIAAISAGAVGLLGIIGGTAFLVVDLLSPSDVSVDLSPAPSAATGTARQVRLAPEGVRWTF